MKEKRFYRKCDKCRHCLNAYMTLEATWIFSMCILLYFLIVMAALLLFARCLSSQNDYIIGLRGARFTEAGEAYGEVIYGGERFDAASYMRERLDRAGNTYPVYRQEGSDVSVDGDQVLVRTFTGSRIGNNECEKKIRRNNPLEKVRAERGNMQ